MLPQLAQGEANKIWVIPSEFSQALGGLAEHFGASGAAVENGAPAPRRRQPTPERLEASERAAADAAEAAEAARAASAEAASAAMPGAPAPPPSDPPTP
jgi:hypothetical protein